MGTLTLFLHTSLDGFAAGINGQMDWIYVDEEIFDYGAERIFATDIALYGRKTYQLMESYWPTAADQPNPTKHDLDDKMVQTCKLVCFFFFYEGRKPYQHSYNQ